MENVHSIHFFNNALPSQTFKTKNKTAETEISTQILQDVHATQQAAEYFSGTYKDESCVSVLVLKNF